MAIYGYCRISQKKQNIERQVRNILNAYPTAIIIREAYTGRKIVGRKEWEKIYRTVKPGDLIVFDSVSRFSRNAEEGFELYQDLYYKSVDLVFLKEPQINIPMRNPYSTATEVSSTQTRYFTKKLLMWV
ncbi:MAG: recombinase family protein [Clostridia bacterium]|nr:recombinase family protein [Clostridia bacterium]